LYEYLFSATAPQPICLAANHAKRVSQARKALLLSLRSHALRVIILNVSEESLFVTKNASTLEGTNGYLALLTIYNKTGSCSL
jgi:hypothetical protein